MLARLYGYARLDYRMTGDEKPFRQNDVFKLGFRIVGVTAASIGHSCMSNVTRRKYQEEIVLAVAEHAE